MKQKRIWAKVQALLLGGMVLFPAIANAQAVPTTSFNSTPVLQTSSLPVGIVGQFYSANVDFLYDGADTITATINTAVDGIGMYSAKYGGTDANTNTVDEFSAYNGSGYAIFTGVPQTVGTFPVTLTIADKHGHSVTKDYTIVVKPGPDLNISGTYDGVPENVTAGSVSVPTAKLNLKANTNLTIKQIGFNVYSDPSAVSRLSLVDNTSLPTFLSGYWDSTHQNYVFNTNIGLQAGASIQLTVLADISPDAKDKTAFATDMIKEDFVLDNQSLFVDNYPLGNIIGVTSPVGRYNAPRLVRYGVEPTVYYQIHGVKLPFPNEEVFLSYGYRWEDVQPADSFDNAENAQYIKLKGSSTTIYKISKGVKYKLAAAVAKKVDPDKVIYVNNTHLATFKTGKTITK